MTALRVLNDGQELPLALDQRSFLIGSGVDPSVDLQLPFPSVSRRHATIKRLENTIEVIDNGSRNGLAMKQYWHSRDCLAVDSLMANVGHVFKIGAVELMSLDDELQRLGEPLRTFCKAGAHADISRAMAAIRGFDVVILQTEIGYAVADLARALHQGTARRSYAFTTLECDALPRTVTAMDELFSHAGCGTIFLDITRPRAAKTAPEYFTCNLMSKHYHLWPIIAAPSTEAACEFLFSDRLVSSSAAAWNQRGSLLRGEACLLEVAPQFRALNRLADPN